MSALLSLFDQWRSFMLVEGSQDEVSRALVFIGDACFPRLESLTIPIYLDG